MSISSSLQAHPLGHTKFLHLSPTYINLSELVPTLPPVHTTPFSEKSLSEKCVDPIYHIATTGPTRRTIEGIHNRPFGTKHNCFGDKTEWSTHMEYFSNLVISGRGLCYSFIGGKIALEKLMKYL